MKRKKIIGVMGPGGGATESDLANAEEIGKLIAKNGWILLNGGRKSGVMDAVSKGAKLNGGLTIGILPSDNLEGVSEFIDIPIVTGIGSARNNINILSSDIVVACGIGMGTLSEISLAIKADKKVILINNNNESKIFLNNLSWKKIGIAESPSEVAKLIKNYFD